MGFYLQLGELHELQGTQVPRHGTVEQLPKSGGVMSVNATYTAPPRSTTGVRMGTPDTIYPYFVQPLPQN